LVDWGDLGGTGVGSGQYGVGNRIDALTPSLINVTVVNDHCTFLSSVYNGNDNAHHKRTFLAEKDST
jgi:hypothetical protein